MRPPDKRKTAPAGSRGGSKIECLDRQINNEKYSTDPAPTSMPQPPNVAVLDLFDATRVSGRGPSACLALIAGYGIGVLLQTPEGQSLRIDPERFRAAAIAEWGLASWH